MKKRFDTILSDLVTDYEVTRENFEKLEDAASQELAIQALANTLVLIQTAIQNRNMWIQGLVYDEELATKKLVNKDIRENGIDRANSGPVEVK